MNGHILSDQEKANLLSTQFEMSHKLTLNIRSSVDRTVQSAMNRLNRNNTINNDHTTYSTTGLIKEIISKVRPSKSPGLDKISNKILKQLPPQAIELLNNIFNQCLKRGYFPNLYKKAKVIPIPKPNKDKYLPSSYRPISLLSNIGKLFEKIIHIRLSELLEQNNLISPQQFGFRSQHSTVHQILRVFKAIKQNKSDRKSTGMILLDIEKAFDTVWHDGLIYKLLKHDVPLYICKILKSFLTDRSFVVQVGQALSNEKHIPAGVPQGSILSPLLYSFYTSDYKPLKCSEVCYYADDTAFLIKGKQTPLIIKNMNRQLKNAEKYFLKWKIKTNAAKTQCILFPYSKSPKLTPRTPLPTSNGDVPFSKEITYLGVTIDNKLLFHKHIERACIKTTKCMRSLYPLICKRSKLSLHNKNIIFKTIIRPIMIYGFTVWRKAAKTNIKKLQIIQNKALKIIHNLPWRYSTKDLHELYHYPMINDYISSLNSNLKAKCEASTFPLLLELADYF